MNKVPNHPWWSMSPIKPGETRDDDYADMGTAFGLDASLTPPVEPPAEPEIERIDLTEVLNEVARLTAPRWRDAPQAEGRPIELRVRADPGCWINGSPMLTSSTSPMTEPRR